MLPVVLGLSACTTTHYHKAADKEAYKAISDKTPAVPGMNPQFTIDQTPVPPLDDLPVATEAPAFLGEAADAEQGAHTITLEQALDLAVKHNREYQSRKEAVFLQALDLTLQRHAFAPLFSGTAQGNYNRTTRDMQELSKRAVAAQELPRALREFGNLAGTPGHALSTYADLIESAASVTGVNAPHTTVVDERSVTANTGLGVDVLLKGGARIAADLTSNFLRFLTGDPGVNRTSALTASITQPLLRGAGSKVNAERLTQAERDLLYALRDFARYRQQFTVKVCSDYYGVLQDRDTARNNWQSFQSFIKNTDRERAFLEEGQRTQANVSRLEQAQLASENSWISSVRTYKQALDQFKIELGLPTDAAVVLDDGEMRHLKDRGLIQPKISDEDSMRVALASRLDLYTDHDRFDDAGRKVVVAANALKPTVNLVANANVPSQPRNQFQHLDLERAQISGGLDLDLGLDRKAERNAYRAALIAQDRSQRDLDLAEDQVKLDVRNAWRGLDLAQRAYEIAQQALELNRRRVEEQNLLAELGRATALNQVDAQNDLTSAENNLTGALVSHTIARLAFWRDIGILFIKEDGQWEEINDVQQP